MKYCPHCGAALEVSAAAFCPECGVSLTAAPTPVPRQKPKKKTQSRKKPTPAKRRLPDDYDGYYRDTPVADGGQVRTGLDPILAKKIALLAVGVAIVVGLAILAMHFL